MALDKSLIPLTVKMDAKYVIKLVLCAISDSHPFGPIIDDCRLLLNQLHVRKIEHIFQETNATADILS